MAKKILLIDDEINFTNLLQERLKNSGFEVATALDGMEGLKKVHYENPDLILLDCLLPFINGYQLCSMIKRDWKFKDIPIIMLSARAPEDIQVGDGDKPEFYFRKPIDSEQLLTKINELLAITDSKKDEEQKKSDEQAQQWMKQHYIPGTGKGNVFGT